MKKTNILALSLVASLSLQAAQPHVPNIGDALQQVKPPKIKQEKKELPKVEMQKEKPLKEFYDSKKIAIKNITVDRVVHVDYEDIREIVSAYENRDLSFADIQEIASKITKLYRANGYFVARAYIPEQNILKENNNLKFSIIEGEYGEFELRNHSLVKDSILQANLDNIKSKNIISTNTLERAMLIINDTPGATVTKAEVKPGKEVGSSDFIIGTDATSRYGGYILSDNYGSQYTGRHRLIAGADINSPFKIGDKLSILGLTSESAGLLNARLAYDFPLYENGLRANISYAKTTYELGNKYKDLDAVGTSDSITLKLTYPLIKSRLQKLDLYLDSSYNKMKDEIQANSVNIKKDSLVATLGADFTKDYIIFGANFQTRADVSYTIGNLEFENKVDEVQDKAGADINGVFSKVNVELGQDFELGQKTRWENSLQMQYALSGKNLDGSQDLSIGGIYGVRYYPDGEESAENGFIFNTELFYELPSFVSLNSKVSVFYDIGRVYATKNFTGDYARTLQDVGLGYTGSYKTLYLNTHLAKNLSNNMQSEEKKFDLKFLFQAGWIF